MPFIAGVVGGDWKYNASSLTSGRSVAAKLDIDGTILWKWQVSALAQKDVRGRTNSLATVGSASMLVISRGGLDELRLFDPHAPPFYDRSFIVYPSR